MQRRHIEKQRRRIDGSDDEEDEAARGSTSERGDERGRGQEVETVRKQG